MSAKSAKQSAPRPAPTASTVPTSTEPASAASGTIAAAPSWLDSTDPRKRMWGKVILYAVWIYVGALWLLALDQTFHWGIFGPKVPPVP